MLRTTRIRTIYRLPHGTAARFSVRQIIARELRDAGTEAVESARHVLTELVAERQRDLQPGVGMTVDVTRARRGRQRWAVVDRGQPSWPTELRSSRLDRLADAWGVSRDRGQTRTWFERR